MEELKVQNPKQIKINKTPKKSYTEYGKKKEAYLKFKEKNSKTDFANSPVIIEKELNMLTELKEIAQSNRMMDETRWIENCEIELKKKRENPQPSTNYAYSPVKIKFTKEYKVPDIQTLYIFAQNEGINKQELDEIIQQGISSKGDISLSLYDDITNIIKKGKPFQDLMFCEVSAGNSPVKIKNNAYRALDYFTQAGIEKENAKILADFFTYYTGTNKSEVVTNLIKLNKAGIPAKSCVKIIKDSKVNFNSQINPDTINSIITLKKVLSTTRNNEAEERNNPIYKAGIQIWKFLNKVDIIRNNNVIYSGYDFETASKEEQTKHYEMLVNKIETDVMSDFIKSYSKDGAINSKFVRVFTFLRNNGIVYEDMKNLMKECINKKGELNKTNLETITALKKSGVLSCDVSTYLNEINNSKEPQKTLENICEMTSKLMTQKEITEILPLIEKNPNVKDVVLTAAPLFLQEYKINELLNELTEKIIFDKNVSTAISNMYDDLQKIEDSELHDIKMKQIIYDVLSAAADNNNIVREDALKVISEINGKNYNFPPDLEKCLNICKTKGNINEKLIKILHNMVSQNATIEEIESLISACKDKTDRLAGKKVNSITELFENGTTKETILKSFVK